MATLSNYEVVMCIVALGETLKIIDEGERASVRLGCPFSAADTARDMLALKAKLESEVPQ